jgi:hypothetical protein
MRNSRLAQFVLCNTLFTGIFIGAELIRHIPSEGHYLGGPLSFLPFTAYLHREMGAILLLGFALIGAIHCNHWILTRRKRSLVLGLLFVSIWVLLAILRALSFPEYIT